MCLSRRIYKNGFMQLPFSTDRIKWVTNKNILIVTFGFTYVVTFTGVLSFFMWICVTVQRPLSSPWITSFSISYRTAIHSLIFALSGNVLISPSFFKDSFSGYTYLAGSMFFQHFVSHPCLLASMVSDKRSAANIIEDHLHVMIIFLFQDYL